MADFRGYVTAAGQTFEALAKQMGYPVTIGFIEIGDGKLPDSESPIDRTQLVHKLKQFPAVVEQDAKNPGQWVATCYIPADDAIDGAGYFIREIGCKLINQGAGVLYAYRRVSDDWKPVITSGEAKSFIYKLRFIPSNGELLTPTIDPSIVLVDKEELARVMKAHVESRNHPDASETEKGFSRHATQSEVDGNRQNQPGSNPVVTVEKLWNFVGGVGGSFSHAFSLWKRTMSESGYDLIGLFGQINEIENPNQVLLTKDGTKVYAWTGPLPKTTALNETPDVDINWSLVSDISLREQLSGEKGASHIGLGNTTVERILSSEFFIDYFAPVLDYGPIFNAIMQSSAYGGKIKLRGERYPVLTTINRRAGWGIEGVGPYATELYWDGGDGALIQYDKILLKSRNGEVIGNKSGQYHTSLQKLSLIGNGKGLGLWRGEGWWDRVSEVIIEGFDIGQKDGIGYSNQSGCFWCVNDQVWYRNNRVNLHVTDGSNLNLWSMCRFSGATDWDIEFIEPTNAQVLGQQGNRFSDCEWASNNSIYLGAKIFDLNFHNPYFEQAGYAIYDGTSHVKGSVTFTGTPKFFGKKSVRNKIVAGHNGGSCQNWAFYNLKTNLGKGVGAPDINYLIDMGDGANYFSVIGPTVQTGADGWELTQESNYSRLKMQLFDVNGKSVLFAKSISSELLISNKSHVVVDYKNLRDVGVDIFEAGVSLGELNSSWQTVMTIPDFVIQYSFATLHCELTISGRNPTFNRIHSAHIGFELDSENGVIMNNAELYNRQTGTTNVHVEYRLLVNGETALVQVRNDSTSINNLYDQVYCAVEAKVAGKFPAMCS